MLLSPIDESLFRIFRLIAARDRSRLKSKVRAFLHLEQPKGSERNFQETRFSSEYELKRDQTLSLLRIAFLTHASHALLYLRATKPNVR